MSWFAVDVEADGPTPMRYSMVCIGAVIVGRHETHSFYARTRPIHDTWCQDALAVSGFTREQHLTFHDPALVMREFAAWIEEVTIGEPVMVSDNPAFDWQWVNGYFHLFLQRNPFGHSARRIGDLYAGLKGKASAAGDWRKLRATAHTHHPVDDARGVAEALAKLREMGLKLDLDGGAARSRTALRGAR